MEPVVNSIADHLSHSQQRQLGGLIRKLMVYGQGDVELLIEKGKPKRYLLRHDPLMAEIPAEIDDGELARLFPDGWPWWTAIATAIYGICRQGPGYGSVVIQIDSGLVRSVRSVVHVPSLPPSGKLRSNGIDT